MKKLLLLLTLLLLISGSFYIGRFTAPAPHFEASESASNEPLDAAFETFIQAQRDTLELYKAHENFDDPLATAEAYRGLLYTLVGSIKSGALMSHDYPRAMRGVDWTSKAGLDNPDNNYFFALLDDDGSYRLSGKRGNTTQLIFQLVIGVPGVGNAGTSTNIDVLYDEELVLDEDGNFEIVISPERPPGASNWMQNGPGAESLLVRFTHSDWQTERIDPLYIERLDTDGSPPEPLTEAAMVAGFQRVSQSMYDRTATWIQLADRWWTMAPNNSVSAMRMTPGGLVGQYSAFGSFDLSDDEAMLIEFGDTGAPYMGIQLGNRWFVSMDYENHTSTLNMHQLGCRNDPTKCYVIVAKNDPGVANWLDTAGHNDGLIFMRWQGLKTPPQDEHQPHVTLLDSESLATFVKSLPAISREERRAAIEVRRRSVHERFGG
jgi:hypothetical protein